MTQNESQLHVAVTGGPVRLSIAQFAMYDKVNRKLAIAWP
jgi:hypothetical protein